MVVRFTRRVLNSAESVIAPTEKVRSLLMGYGVHREINVVPTGINLDKFAAPLDESEISRKRSELGIPVGNKVLVTVGRLALEKNVEEILLYLAKFISDQGRNGLTLLIVGDGPHREALEQYAWELGISENVIFTGMIDSDEVASYYRLGDIFTSASCSETQGLTYIEALASGIPALCRKDPSLENVIQDGFNGWQYQSYKQFGDCLAEMLDDESLHQRLSENAREDAEIRFSSASFAKKAEHIYWNVICRYHEQEAVSFATATR